jgi:hypothetical protein
MTVTTVLWAFLPVTVAGCNGPVRLVLVTSSQLETGNLNDKHR